MGFSLQLLLIAIASLVVEHRLNSCGTWTQLPCVRSSPPRGQTCVSCIVGHILHQWVTGKPSFTILTPPRAMSLNFPVSKKIEIKKKTLKKKHCCYHSRCLFRNAQLQTVQTPLILAEILTCPPSEKAWLKAGKTTTSPKLFPGCLNRLTISWVSQITPEWKADTGMSVFCFLL